MKKKQVFALLLAGSILFTGWGMHADAAPAGATENESAAAEQPASDAGGEGETAEKVTAENAAEAAAESGTAADAAEAAAGGYVIDGGDPWIDSNLKENVVNAGRLSEKDDFSEAVNYDWVMENEIPEGYGSWDEIYNVEKIVEDKAIAALEDQELTGRDAELARTLYQAFLDWEERDKVGLAPLESLVKDIESVQDVSALTAFLCDRDRSALVHKPVAIGNTQDLTDSTRYVVDMDYTNPLLEDAAADVSPVAQGDLVDGGPARPRERRGGEHHEGDERAGDEARVATSERPTLHDRSSFSSRRRGASATPPSIEPLGFAHGAVIFRPLQARRRTSPARSKISSQSYEAPARYAVVTGSLPSLCRW